jgi:hypothetical protein
MSKTDMTDTTNETDKTDGTDGTDETGRTLAAFGVEEPSTARPPDACVRWRECGETTTANNALCAACLTRARHAGHGRGRTVLGDRRGA